MEAVLLHHRCRSTTSACLTYMYIYTALPPPSCTNTITHTYILFLLPKMASTTTPSSSLFAVFLLLLLLWGVSRHPSEAREPFACDPKDATTRNLPFCRVSLPIPERVRDLIGRLTLQEKVRLLVNNAAAVPRLRIKGYEWWSEALHGVSNVGPGTKFGGDFPGATSFPQVITTAASFNASLWEAIGRVRRFSFFFFLFSFK
jgi:hypothetical protein